MITDKEIKEIIDRWNNSTPGPWTSYIEGRDFTSGSSFIMTGTKDNRGPDINMYESNSADLDFIANAKQDIPKLIEEIKRLKHALDKKDGDNIVT